MLFLGLTFLGASLCGRGCCIIHGSENDGAAPFPIPLFTWQCYPGEILVRIDNLFVECVGISDSD